MPIAAMQPGAPAVWDEVPDNIGFLWKRGDADRTEQALRDAAHVTRLQFTVSRVTANSMEPRGAWAEIGADGRLVLHPSIQSPYPLRNGLAQNNFKLAAEGHPGAGRRCRRLVRHEVRRAAGIRAGLLGGAQVQSSGALDLRPHRRLAHRRASARDAHHRGTGAGCGRQIHRAEAALGCEPGRLCVRPFRLAGRQYRRHCRRLSHPDDLRRSLRHHDAHGAHRGVSRRRPAGGDLHDRAPDRCCRARAGHRSRTNCAGAT